MKKQNTPTLADTICDLRVRKIKKQFFTQINDLLDWDSISKMIDKHCPRGSNAVGQSSYDGLLLFKMSLLQTWYGLSDYEVEDRVNDSLSFSYFCGLSIHQPAPDHSTLSRFRTAMTKAGVYEKCFYLINEQLESKGILVKKGALVDASVVPTPLKPKSKPTHEVAQDRVNQEPEKTLAKEYPASVDQEASWLKKGGKYYYGFKKHYVTNDEGMVLGVESTKASVNEISNLDQVLDKARLPKRIPVKADKGYQSKKNNDLLKSLQLKNHILKKAKRNQSLSQRELNFNKKIGETRFKVERTFGSIKRWFGGGVARYRGLNKMHTQNLLEALCYNLYRSPGIIASNCEI